MNLVIFRTVAHQTHPEEAARTDGEEERWKIRTTVGEATWSLDGLPYGFFEEDETLRDPPTTDGKEGGNESSSLIRETTVESAAHPASQPSSTTTAKASSLQPSTAVRSGTDASETGKPEREN